MKTMTSTNRVHHLNFKETKKKELGASIFSTSVIICGIKFRYAN